MSMYEFWDTYTNITQANVNRLETMWTITHSETIGQALDKAYAIHEIAMQIFHMV